MNETSQREAEKIMERFIVCSPLKAQKLFLFQVKGAAAPLSSDILHVPVWNRGNNKQVDLEI